MLRMFRTTGKRSIHNAASNQKTGQNNLHKQKLLQTSSENPEVPSQKTTNSAQMKYPNYFGQTRREYMDEVEANKGKQNLSGMKLRK